MNGSQTHASIVSGAWVEFFPQDTCGLVPLVLGKTVLIVDRERLMLHDVGS